MFIGAFEPSGDSLIATAWTILGTIGGAILAAVVGKLVTSAFELSAQLIATVTINQSFRSPLLANEVREWRTNSVPLEDRPNDPIGTFDKYNDYFQSDTYIRLELKNNSKKTIKALTFCAHCIGAGVMQIGDGELVALAANVPAALGDLQPKRAVLVHVLASSFSAETVREIKVGLVFSADELGRVKYKFPLPYYFKDRFRDWALLLVLFLFSVPLLLIIIALIHDSYTASP